MPIGASKMNGLPPGVSVAELLQIECHVTSQVTVASFTTNLKAMAQHD